MGGQMDIEDAFTQEAIQAADTNVGGAEEDEIRELIQRLVEDNEVENLSNDQANVMVLAFVAGRTYQANLEVFPVPMSRQLMMEFMEYLVKKGAT
jgi:hypothetical protein